MENVSQIAILILSCTSVFFITRKDEWTKWGYVLGLCSQPFWLYTTYTHQQWGMFLLSIFYTYRWAIGINNYWIKKDDK